MYDAGYDPQAVVSFFNKMKAQGESRGGPQFLSSHPDPGNRAKNISSILSRFPPKQFQDVDSPTTSLRLRKLLRMSIRNRQLRSN